MRKLEGLPTPDPNIFKVMTSEDNFEKNLAMTLANYDVQPPVNMYNILMREKVKEMSGSYPVDIEAKWDSQA